MWRNVDLFFYYYSLQNEIDTTGTYKYLKAKLTEEGFNPAGIKEPLFVLDETMKSYRTLTQETYESILEGHFRLWIAGQWLLKLTIAKQ